MVAAVKSPEHAPLEDLMLSMDVVDTLRHQQELVDRELDAEGRRERLIERLREIYAAQGIEVSDAVLAEGVKALEEDRFRYDPPANSWSVKLARLYVSRERWIKPVVFFLSLAIAAVLIYFFMIARPQMQQAESLPGRVARVQQDIARISVTSAAREESARLRRQAERAISEGNMAEANKLLAQLRALRDQLEQVYEVKIVSRPNTLSGVWRVPESNPDTRNYYLIVEAVDSAGKILSVPIANEEDGAKQWVTTWGLRVSEETFEAVAADKKDDGIIQANVIGRKLSGKLEPDYLLPASGASITEW